MSLRRKPVCLPNLKGSRLLAGLLGVLVLPACMMGPVYERPVVAIPPAFKELQDWKLAEPQTGLLPSAWWLLYRDPVLTDLEDQVVRSNQTLKAAAATAKAAQAITAETRAGLFPSASVGADVTRYQGEAAPSERAVSSTLSAAVSWTPDFWGRVQRTLERDTADAKASTADLATAQLSLQTELAASYFELRVQDNLIFILQKTTNTNEQTLHLTERQYRAGLSTQADVYAATAQLESAKAQALHEGVKRAQLEHAIAVLVGQTPASFMLKADASSNAQPVVPESIPVSVPSRLLERRPDIAAAEQRLISANAQIGVVEATWFPDITLSATMGQTGSALGTLAQAANGWWGIGSALSQTVFDAGARQSTVEKARADYEQSVAAYRQTVLTAFKEVEDQLAAQRILAQQVGAQRAALEAARQAEKLALQQYQRGLGSYNSVLVAQLVSLARETELLELTRAQYAASLALMSALGGGWTDVAPPTKG